jgi:hypothetical protein
MLNGGKTRTALQGQSQARVVHILYGGKRHSTDL